MLRSLVASLAVSVALIGCGGGGGGTPAVVASTNTFASGAMFVNSYLTSSSQRFTVTGNTLDTNKPITGSGTAVLSALTGVVFEGQAAQRRTSTLTGTLTVDGTNSPLAVTSYAYLDANYNYLGEQSNNEYSVVDGAFTIPKSVRVNDTGTIGTLKRYSNSTKTTLLGTEVVTYTVEPDTASTAMFKLIRTSRDNSGKTVTVATSVTRLNADGTYKNISEIGTDYTDKITLTITFE